MTERITVVRLRGFQGSPLPGSGVARQGLRDDNDERWRDLEEGSYMKETIISLSPLWDLCVQSTDGVTQIVSKTQ